MDGHQCILGVFTEGCMANSPPFRHAFVGGRGLEVPKSHKPFGLGYVGQPDFVPRAATEFKHGFSTPQNPLPIRPGVQGRGTRGHRSAVLVGSRVHHHPTHAKLGPSGWSTWAYRGSKPVWPPIPPSGHPCVLPLCQSSPCDVLVLHANILCGDVS